MGRRRNKRLVSPVKRKQIESPLEELTVGLEVPNHRPPSEPCRSSDQSDEKPRVIVIDLDASDS